MRSRDGHVVAVENRGIRRAAPDIMARMLAGETVAPTSYYFRATPRFDAGDGPLRWMSESIFLCAGARLPDQVVLRYYVVT